METNIEKGKGQVLKKTLLLGMLAIVFVSTSACTTQAPDSDAVAIAVEGTMTALASEATPLPTATSSTTATATSTATPAPTNTPTSTYTPTRTPTPGIYDLIPPRGDYQHGYEVTEEYNKFDDATDVRSSAPFYDVVIEGKHGLVIDYSYEGTEPAAPSTVLFTIVSRNQSWEYLRCHSLVILVDDNIRISPKTDHEGSVLDGGEVLEQVYAFLDVDEFLQIVNADKVELKLCNDEWALTAADLEALKDVASRMTPKSDQDGVDL